MGLAESFSTPALCEVWRGRHQGGQWVRLCPGGGGARGGQASQFSRVFLRIISFHSRSLPIIVSTLKLKKEGHRKVSDFAQHGLSSGLNPTCSYPAVEP